MTGSGRGRSLALLVGAAGLVLGGLVGTQAAGASAANALKLSLYNQPLSQPSRRVSTTRAT